MRRPAGIAAVVTLSATLALAVTTRPASVPATGPSTIASTEPATRPLAVVNPAAEPLLARLRAVYSAKQPLHLAGTLVGEFDVAGRQKTYTLPIDGRTDGGGRFVHAASGAGLLVSDGVDAYLFDVHRNAYARLTATPGRAAADEIDPALVGVLLDEDPALLLTLVDDADALLRRVATAIRPAAGGGLELDRPGKRLTLRLDPSSGRILRSVIDFTPLMTARHANGVKAARATLTYTTDAAEPPPAGAFAWHPPVSATEFDTGQTLLKTGPTAGPATRPTTRATSRLAR